MVGKTTLLTFPPHSTPDLVDRLASAQAAWRRDDGLGAKVLLEGILDDYPWSPEALALYGEVAAATRHCFSPVANYRLYEHAAGAQLATGHPAEINDGVERFKVMKDWMREWLANHGRTSNRAYWGQVVPFVPRDPLPQWADLLDVAGADGAMAAEWIGLPGARYCINLDLSYRHCHMGHGWRSDPRLHFIQGAGDSIPSPDLTYDVVVLSGILEHVASPESFIAETHRVLRLGGLLLIQVPYGGTEWMEDHLYRFHVRTIDPFAIVPWGKLIHSHYIDYTQDVRSPHAHHGDYGDYIVAYEKVS